MTAGKTDIVEGIQEIGFTQAILSTDANDPFPEFKGAVTVVFELNQ